MYKTISKQISNIFFKVRTKVSYFRAKTIVWRHFSGQVRPLSAENVSRCAEHPYRQKFLATFLKVGNLHSLLSTKAVDHHLALFQTRAIRWKNMSIFGCFEETEEEWSAVASQSRSTFTVDFLRRPAAFRFKSHELLIISRWASHKCFNMFVLLPEFAHNLHCVNFFPSLIILWNCFQQAALRDPLFQLMAARCLTAAASTTDAYPKPSYSYTHSVIVNTMRVYVDAQ